MTYILDHWYGRHALPRAFWINFLLTFVLIVMAEPWVRPVGSDSGSVDAIAAVLYILIAYVIILPWQIVGLWRSSRRHLSEGGDVSVVTFAQGAALIGFVVAAGITVSVVQRLTGFGYGTDETNGAETPRYRLEVRVEDRTLTIDGPFDIGLSRDLELLLADADGIDAIILNSNGGRVFEARGVARQIVQASIDTIVLGHCRSACTIAFVAGKTRKLGEGGQLGFHSYALETAMAFIDPLEEQEKDKLFFKEQGVQRDFIERIFATPHDDMWHPSIDQLSGANVVHRLIEK